MSDRPAHSITAVICAVFVALSLLAAATEAIPALRHAYDSLTAPSRSATEKELTPAYDMLSTQFLLLARKTIPQDAVYSIVVGDTPETQPLLHEAIRPLVSYWLLPRRFTEDLDAAEWIVTYHESSEDLGVPIAKEIGLGPEGNVVQVDR